MGITRSSFRKRRVTGGRQCLWRKKRKHELGRQGVLAKLTAGETRIHKVRVRNGGSKLRALRLDAGNFSWASQTITKGARIVDVVYNSSNNELVRTKTLVKGAIIEIDAKPLRDWYEAKFGKTCGGARRAELVKLDKDETVEPALAVMFDRGTVLARISSRPGQGGRADGYILEGPELDFYKKKLEKK